MDCTYNKKKMRLGKYSSDNMKYVIKEDNTSKAIARKFKKATKTVKKM